MNPQVFLPVGIARLLNYQSRLYELGLDKHMAFDRKYRNALEISNFEILPRDLLATLDVVVDVGANVGDWSIACALLTQARKIIAYEPLPQVYAQLVIRTRPYPQISAKQLAIGEKEGETIIHVEHATQLSSILELRKERRGLHGLPPTASDKMPVRIATLDSQLADYDEISLLKLDVQGYEPQVIAGARSILPKVRVLLTEITYAPYYKGDLQFLEFCNLMASVSSLELWGISCPHCSASGRPLWADAVFVRQ